jgi:hypothetical protein
VAGRLRALLGIVAAVALALLLLRGGSRQKAE